MEETGLCRQLFKTISLKKWQVALDAFPEMTGGTSRKAGSIRRFLRSNTPGKDLKPSLSVLKPVCHWGLPNAYMIPTPFIAGDTPDGTVWF